SAMLFNSVMPEDKFEKEKGIVLEEIAKSFGNVNDQIERNILPIIYKGHALSLSTLGTYETIKNMNRDDVYEFYKNFYVPNNMIISVIGSFNSKEMLENIKEIYGKAKPGVVKEANTYGLNIAFENVPSLDNEQNVYHRFYSGNNTQLQLFFELPTPKNLEFYDVLNLVLENQSETIKNELNQKFENAIDGIEFKTREYKVKSFLQVTATLNSENNINSIKDSLISKLGIVNFKLSPETVKTEEIKARTSFLQNTEKPHMFGIYNADLFAQYGMESILASYSGKGYDAAAEEVTQISITRDPLIIVQHPNLLSSENDIIENQLPKLFENKNGGATVIAKESKGSDILAIHYLIKNKAAYEEKYGKDAAKILHDIFGDRMNQPEVQKQSAKYGFTFTVNDNPFIPMDNIYLSPEFGYIRVEGLGDNIKNSISYLNEQMIAFIPTEDEFMTATGKSKMPSMMGHGNMAKLLFDNKVNEIVYEEEKFKENKTPLSYENLLEFAKFYFQPSNMIISVVSKETPESINTYFANFAKPIPEGTIDNPAFVKEFKEISQPINVNLEGGGEQSYLYYGFQKNIDKNDEAALQVLSLLLSDKIVFDIREKQGMAYRIRAGIDVVNDKAMFNINMGTRPENIDKLIPQLPNFFTKKYLGTVSEDEVTKSVNMYLG
ncbi:MAG: insulinase family protein, partial [Ignavibacteriae bacterium]|nr:insulinase family protein [Ignavibacteriota bacterium]